MNVLDLSGKGLTSIKSIKDKHVIRLVKKLYLNGNAISKLDGLEEFVNFKFK